MAKLEKVSPFRLTSLLRLQKDPNLALQLFLNPNPSPKPFRYSLLSYDLIITKLGRAKMFDEMEQIIKQLKNETRLVPKEIIFCNIITFYGRAHLPDRALKAFDQIPSFRCQRTIKSLNSLLNALLSCREFEKMREFFVGIDQYAVPDVCTYNILINVCCLCNDLDSAWNVFDEMKKRRIWPNAVTFGTLISGLCANCKLDEAFRLKEAMVRGFRLKPNAFVYASLIKGLCKANELSLAFKLKDEMLKCKIELGLRVYSTLISALFKVGRKEDVIGVLEEMRENGCKPDAVTYNAMIYGFCQEKDFDAAFGVLSEMEVKGCKPDVTSYNVIIGGLCRDGKLREANELFEDMPRRKCAPDVITYRTLFDGLCDGMHFKEAAFILDEMVFKGYAPRTASMMKFVDELCQSGNLNLLWTVLNSLAKGNLIDVDTWRMVVHMVCKNNKLLNASELVETLQMP
ncbi:putative pentatricopeptide repeat-containing protein [Camellia lanceoleosa]|uniref:Pentatricopeptide repeat-containing protein n=1 Tax=Camellia lanceoleosa TaxID=1840588 RepID=A0ACC0HBJ7_9ERIC|nr:putative pentatricopeptide repeat-containing protein [Camellia lanceoleosa]